jgi:hypothetical protein
VFVVVLVIAMLGTIGVFAAGSASLATAASGSARHSTQAHYVAEYALLTAISELSTPRVEAYVRAMADPNAAAICSSENATSGTRSCYVFGRTDLEQLVGQSLFTSAPLGGVGSLGPPGVDADFRVEMTDLGPAAVPVVGSDLTSSGAADVTYKSVTLTSYARTFLSGTGTSASLHATRTHLIVGPLPPL